MSWFTYDVPKPRSLRKGVYLRVRNLPPDMLEQWSAVCQPRPNEQLDMVKVLEIRPAGRVLVECWSHVPFIDHPTDKHVVVTFETDENPFWVCEGDLGRGFKPNRHESRQDECS